VSRRCDHAARIGRLADTLSARPLREADTIETCSKVEHVDAVATLVVTAVHWANTELAGTDMRDVQCT
jgi:hypothetical protein